MRPGTVNPCLLRACARTGTEQARSRHRAHMATDAIELAAGVVLAGGGSRRMGQPKAALLIDGEPLLQRVVGRLQATLPGRTLVVGSPELAPLVPGVEVIGDRRPGAGPL